MSLDSNKPLLRRLLDYTLVGVICRNHNLARVCQVVNDGLVQQIKDSSVVPAYYTYLHSTKLVTETWAAPPGEVCVGGTMYKLST